MLSEKEQKQLDALLQKKKEEAIKDRNQKKKDDRTCERLFGMKVDDVKAALDGRTSVSDTSALEDLKKIKELVNRFCAVKRMSPAHFEAYIKRCEENAQKTESDGRKNVSMNQQIQIAPPAGAPSAQEHRGACSEAQALAQGQP